MQKPHFFLHGLDSSGKGTKGHFFTDHFPYVHCPDFEGDLKNRLLKLETLCTGKSDLTLIGSSFGGLIATCYATQNPDQVSNLFLLAPALNYLNYTPPAQKLAINTFLLIGEYDDVTPIDPVVSLAEATFSNLEVQIVKDDHLLHKSFTELDWGKLLMPR